MSERFDEFIKEINEGGKRQSSSALNQYFQSADSFFNASKNYNYNDYSSFQQTSPIKDQLNSLNGAHFNAWVELINNRETIGEDNFNKVNDYLNKYSTAINDFRTNYQKASDYYSKQTEAPKQSEGFFQNFLTDKQRQALEKVKAENANSGQTVPTTEEKASALGDAAWGGLTGINAAWAQAFKAFDDWTAENIFHANNPLAQAIYEPYLQMNDRKLSFLL